MKFIRGLGCTWCWRVALEARVWGALEPGAFAGAGYKRWVRDADSGSGRMRRPEGPAA